MNSQSNFHQKIQTITMLQFLRNSNSNRNHSKKVWLSCLNKSKYKVKDILHYWLNQTKVNCSISLLKESKLELSSIFKYIKSMNLWIKNIGSFWDTMIQWNKLLMLKTRSHLGKEFSIFTQDNKEQTTKDSWDLCLAISKETITHFVMFLTQVTS